MPRGGRLTGLRIGLVVVLILGALDSLMPSPAQAVATFQKAMIRLDRMQKSTATGATVCIQPDVATAISSIQIYFPDTTTASAFTLNGTASNYTVNTTNNPNSLTPNLYWPSGATGLTGISTANNVDTTNRIVTFPLSSAFTPTVGNMYCFNISGTNTITTGSTVSANLMGTIKTRDAGPAVIDLSYVSFHVVDTGYDQIAVSAVVPPIFQFDLNSTTDTVPSTGNLNYQTINESTGVTVTVHTNAKQGWIAWTKDSNQGLTSVSAGNFTIGTVPWNAGAPTAITATTQEKYGLAVFAGVSGTSTCTTTVAGEYNVTSNANQVGAMTSNFQQIGQCAGGTSDGDQLILKERAVIKSTTPAATDYTDTITVVGAGSF
jgi:hypothetical protein